MKASIAFAVNDKYVEHLIVAIYSILVNNKKLSINFYVLSTDISLTSKQKLNRIADKFNDAVIDFINPDTSKINDLQLVIEHISIETYYRYLLPNVLPSLDRILYLDADILVTSDLSGLWNTPLTDHYCAGVEDPYIELIDYKKEIGFSETDLYINAGVILMNLQKMRRDDIAQKLITGTQLNKEIKFQDQDILNITLKNQISTVDSIYNFTARHAVNEPEKHDQAAIIHFTGPDKPWAGDLDLPFHALYRVYKVRAATAGLSVIDKMKLKLKDLFYG